MDASKKQEVARRKADIHRNLKVELGLNVTKPKSGAGSTNNGNSP